MKDSLKDFDELQEHDRRKSELNPLEKDVLDLCITKLISDIGWDGILKEELYVFWIKYLEQENPELKGNPFETYVDNRDQLAKLIREHRKIVIEKVLSQTNSQIIRPDTTLNVNRPYKVQYDKWNILLDELNKKRRVLSVRKLVEEYESIVLRITPCWLATPEAVSSIFPLKRDLFDYVIFDEASQSEVQHSITALYRGKNIV